MEKQIVIFHDPEVCFEKMSQLDAELLQVLQSYFKKHDFEDGLLKAIEHLKLSLQPHFPKNEACQANPVPNKLIWVND